MRAVRFVLLVLALASGACAAKAEVSTATGVPALVPPTPPARVIVPAPEAPTLPVEPTTPASPPPQSGTTTRPTPPPTRPTPPTPPPVAETPPLVLSTVMSADFEKRIRAQLGRAEADLARVNRQALGSEARAQYDAARGFIRQCEAALKVRNLVFAGQLADKAATMAGLLRR